MMSEDTSLPPEAAVFIAFTATVAAAVASMFMAVPVMVWSALKLMAATASKSEYSMPAAALATSVVRIMTGAPPASTGKNFITSAPPRAPITMMPSKPILITPLRSEKHPPRATSISTEANRRVYCKSKIMRCCLPSSVQASVLPLHPSGADGSGWHSGKSLRMRTGK